MLFDAKKFNLDNYRQKIHKILSTIDKTPISTVVFFVAPKNRIVAESTPFCKPEEIKGTRTMQIIKIWKNSFEKYKKTLFRILDVRDISKSWPGPGAYSHDGKCKYCLPGLPDTWSHILFNMLHHTHIQCEIEDFEEVSKHASCTRFCTALWGWVKPDNITANARVVTHFSLALTVAKMSYMK